MTEIGEVSDITIPDDARAAADTIVLTQDDGSLVLKVSYNGTVTFGPGYGGDDFSTQLWKNFGRLMSQPRLHLPFASTEELEAELEIRKQKKNS